MRIGSALIQGSIDKARRNKLDPEKLKAQIGEGDRSRHITQAQRTRQMERFLDETEDLGRASQALERLIGGNDLTSINYLAKGSNAGKSVCRIHLKNETGETTGYGTGFLVAPGVVITNHHVISGAEDAKWAVAEFDYELDIYGKEKPTCSFSILADPLPIANEQLDFCLVAVSPKSDDERRDLSGFGWLPLNPDPGKAVIGEYLTIIQHPGGERKQICVRENKLLRYDPDGNTLWYATDTVAGSSGSPAFNNSWEVVALHHSGVPKTDRDGHWLTVDGKIYDSSMDESRVAWIANEGIRISRIMAFLDANFSDHPIAKAVLARPASPILITNERTQVASDGQYSEYVNGELRVTVPVQISVRVGERAEPAVGTKILDDIKPQILAQVTAKTNVSSLIERVDVDQSNYGERAGYNPEFLGSGAMSMPLPTVKDPTLKEAVLQFSFEGENGSILKYWNYSVVMNKDRKLAFYSAVNVDANQRPENTAREGDHWYTDTRIGANYQIGSEFYGNQSVFEVDRSKNPFDKGHLTRRLDAQWGAAEELAKRNGDDSFHWTNCSPQHWQLNQGKKRWLGLEEYVIATFAKDTGRACVINGPVFDAPMSLKKPDGRMDPNLQGAPHKDPVFGDVPIPKMFFKVVACEGNAGKLQVAAFLMSQEDLLRTIDRLKGMPPVVDELLTPAEARLYQIKLKDLETLTGLDFGALSDSEVAVEEKVEPSVPRLIEEFEDIRMYSSVKPLRK